jgi:hypothetical protein
MASKLEGMSRPKLRCGVPPTTVRLYELGEQIKQLLVNQPPPAAESDS